jgi:hypothetical protein
MASASSSSDANCSSVDDADTENIDPSSALITDCDAHPVALVLRHYPILFVKGNLQELRRKRKAAFESALAELQKKGLRKYNDVNKIKKFISNTRYVVEVVYGFSLACSCCFRLHFMLSISSFFFWSGSVSSTKST